MAKRKRTVLPKDAKKEILRTLFGTITKGAPVWKSCVEVAAHFLENYGYDISPRTLQNYWEKRKQWVSEVYDISDADYTGRDLLAQMMIVINEMWKIYSNTDNPPSVRLNALKLIGEHIKSLLEVMQDLGFIIKGKESAVLSVSQIDQFAKIINDAFPQDKEMRHNIYRALMEHEGYATKSLVDVKSYR